MKTFWKTHPALRIVLMIVLFVLSIALVVAGRKMTGQLAGLGIMLVGVALLLAVLAIYNATYQD
jgi:multisubunit Na+/H+ antiporter MnhF subunit